MVNDVIMIFFRRLEKAGLPVPRVVILKKHVLVMQFLGHDRRPAFKLKEAKLGPADMQLAYEQCIDVSMEAILTSILRLR